MRLLGDILGREQEQWFLWVPTTFGLGISAYFALAEEPHWAAGGVAVATGGIAYALGRQRGLWIVVVGLCATFLCGFAAATFRTWVVAAPVMDRTRGPVVVKGFVELVEPRARGGVRLTVRTTAIEGLAEALWPYRLRVRIRQADPDLKPGIAVAFRAILSPPSSPAYPGDFDFARQAYFLRLGAVGYTVSAPRPAPEIRDAPTSLAFSFAIERLRFAIAERILAVVPGETGHIVLALITGERGGISDATNQAWRDAGLFHILSISGLHMVILAGSLFWLVRFLLALFPPLALRFPIKKWAAAAAILGALAYLLISGGAFATIRSWVMITIIFGAVVFDRPALALRNVAMAALIILTLWPESLLDAGFQMSFAAVVALISVFEWYHARRQSRDLVAQDGTPRLLGHAWAFAVGIVLSTLIASLAVAPFSAFHFHSSQQYALLANLIAIPLCNIVVMPAALGVFIALPFGLEAWPLSVMALGIDWISTIARLTGQLPGATIRIPAIAELGFLLMVVGGLWLLLWQTPWRVAGAAVFLIGVAVAPFARAPHVLIAGEGLLVAARGTDGKLTAVAARGQSFTLQRWLDADGDGRLRDEVAQARGFACDALGCVFHLGHAGAKRQIVLSNAPASLRDDCATADVLVLRYARPRVCWPSDAIVIDREDLATNGTHAIYRGRAGLAVESVEGRRGVRPWTKRGQAAHSTRLNLLERRDLEALQKQGARLGGFAGLSPHFEADDDLDVEVGSRDRLR